MKIDLLQIDCTAYRLRKQIELMTKVSLYFMYEFIPKFYLFFNLLNPGCLIKIFVEQPYCTIV